MVEWADLQDPAGDKDPNDHLRPRVQKKKRNLQALKKVQRRSHLVNSREHLTSLPGSNLINSLLPNFPTKVNHANKKKKCPAQELVAHWNRTAHVKKPTVTAQGWLKKTE